MDSMDYFIFWKEYYANVDYYEQHRLDIDGPLEPLELVENSCEE